MVSRELSLLLLVHLDDINFTHRFPTASSQCGDWCPDGNLNSLLFYYCMFSLNETLTSFPPSPLTSYLGTECQEPYSCFADTSCYYDKDISPSESPTTYKPTTSPTITYSR